MFENKLLFTYDLFLILKNKSEEAAFHKENIWIKISYESFINYPLNSKKDLIHLIAFAYSWMPTMAKLKVDYKKLNEEVVNEINDFKMMKDFSFYNEYELKFRLLLYKLVGIINNSIVGTSKVLHFSNPNLFPIIDSKVIKGLKLLIETAYPQNNIFRISQSSLSYKNQEKAILYYISYTKTMLYWLKEIRKHQKNITLRELEYFLYLVGG